jgi:hypothetical protein
MITCPQCGLELPGYARFCARCGVRLPAARVLAGANLWILLLFGVGAALGALMALIYSVIAVTPDLPASGLDPERVRATAVFLAVVGASVCALQVAAVVGLALGREWGRVVAPIVCVAWSLTCIGLPVSLAVISSLWARKNAPLG